MHNFRPKLYDKRFNYHFVTSIWNCLNTGLGQFKYFIDAVLSRFEIKSSIFGGEKIRVLEIKVAKFAT